MSWSVALPLPSSPHWAPSTTIPGIENNLPSAVRNDTTCEEPGCNSTRALATTRYQGPARSSIVRAGPVRSMVAAWNRCCSSPTSTPAAAATRRSRSPSGCCGRTPTSRSPTTSNPGELDGVLHRAGCRQIVVAGGDGSLHAVVKALHRRHELAKRTLGLIPLGTGNDFARTLGIPLDPGEAAAALMTGESRPMDLIVDELGGVVVNSVHAGASAQASRRGARWKDRLGPYGFGILGYPIGAAMAAVRPPFVRLRIEADGEVDLRHGPAHPDDRRRQRHQCRRRHRADPRRRPRGRQARRDGLVRDRPAGAARLRLAAALGRARGARRRDLASAPSQVTVSGEDFFLAADGEISGPERRRSWHLEQAAYSMVVPHRAEEQSGSASAPRRRPPRTTLSFSTRGSPASAK